MSYEQKVYDITLRFRGELFHTTPVLGVTKEEMRLLMTIHGNDSVPPSEVRFKGVKVIKYIDNESQEVEVRDQMGEYRRLARKYDKFDSPLEGYGRQLVEKTFGITLDNMDDALAETLTAAELAEQAAIKAEIEAGAAVVPPVAPSEVDAEDIDDEPHGAVDAEPKADSKGPISSIIGGMFGRTEGPKP